MGLVQNCSTTFALKLKGGIFNNLMLTESSLQCCLETYLGYYGWIFLAQNFNCKELFQNCSIMSG